MSNGDRRVVVLGASPRPERYSNRAVRLLRAHDYKVIPVHPEAEEIESLPVVPDLSQINGPIHTLTIYLGPDGTRDMGDSIVALDPERVIFNPGTESPELKRILEAHGIECVEDCTLIMLNSGRF